MKKKLLGLLLVLSMVISLFSTLTLPVNADTVAPSVGDTVTFIDADWMCISVDTDNSDGYTGYKLLRNDPFEDMVYFDSYSDPEPDSINYLESDIHSDLINNYLTSPSIYSLELSSIGSVYWYYGTIEDDFLYNGLTRMGLLTLAEYNAIKEESWYVPTEVDEIWWLATSDGIDKICTAYYNGVSNLYSLTPPNTAAYVRPALWLNADTSFVLNDGKYVATYPFTTPGFNPAGGTVTFPKDITISGYGADHVYYTTDGTTPETSVTGSTLEYTEPITINSNVTIKAISTRACYFPSSVATASYTQASSALTELTLSGTPTGFTFAPDTQTYNGVKVANDVSSVTVAPTGTGTITVNGTEVASGSASAAIPLAIGQEESISVVVAQAGKSSMTYTINITRRSNIWDGVTTEPFTGGGSVGDPYIIDTAEKLAYLAAQVNLGQNYSGKYFKMTADIALNDTTNWQTWDEDTTGLNEWTSIGNDIVDYSVFSGVFDGNGHAVRGVYISDDTSDKRGLFGFIYSGTVKKLGVTQSFISGNRYVGGVAGRAGNDPRIEYCWFSGIVKGNRNVGGVAGRIDSSVQYCFNTGSVSGMSEVGGVFGCIAESEISNCYNSGAISGGYRVGGITGFTIASITNCYNSGVITGLSIPVELSEELGIPGASPLYIGAIVGEASYHEEILACCYDKQMSREASIGGETESEDTAETAGKLTTQMYVVSPDEEDFGASGEWIFENGLYPRLAGMDTTDAAVVSATPVRLQFMSDTVFEISKAVKSDFIVGTPTGVGWTSSNNDVISINDGIADLTRQSVDTTVILTATKNNVSKQVPLMVLEAPAAINPASCNYDLNAPSDITTAIIWNRASSVTGIAYGASPLATPADYSISGNTLTIESGFIAGLSPALNDVINLVITFNMGETATLAVNTVDGFVPVTGITGVPTTATVGTPLTLTGTVTPADAANQTIVWSVADAGTTDVTISDNTLTALAAGTVVVRAAITNGLTASSDYTQDFSITVSAAPVTTYTVTATSGSGGTITPDGAVSVNMGGSQAYTITANSGYRISSVTVDGVNQGAITSYTFTNVTANHMISVIFTQRSGSNNDTPKPPEKTITVTDTSSEVFRDTTGSVTAEANMENAFSNSVEVKVTDTPEDVANFNLSADDEVYPFDISLYIKGTNTRTEPAQGYAVTISLPIPGNLVDNRTSLLIAHKSDNGTITTLNSRLVQKDGIWYLVFEATEFSPYALVVKSSGSYDESTGVYDESAGVPYYLDTKENKVFIGFAANGKFIAPEGVTVSMMQNDKSFTDVAGHWALPYIGFTTERELFLGTSDDNFSPDMGMTRAMFATVIGRLYERSFGGIESSGTHAFTDCDYGAYYGKYVDWTAENEIIMGIGGGTFAPDTLITREQMAAILYRFADFLGVLSDDIDTALEYPDAAIISSYAKDAAIYCQTTGVIGGRTGGVFAPHETATRAEVATIILRFIETVMK